MALYPLPLTSGLPIDLLDAHLGRDAQNVGQRARTTDDVPYYSSRACSCTCLPWTREEGNPDDPEVTAGSRGFTMARRAACFCSNHTLRTGGLEELWGLTPAEDASSVESKDLAMAELFRLRSGSYFLSAYMAEPERLYQFFVTTTNSALPLCFEATDPKLLQQNLLSRVRHASANRFNRFERLGYSELYNFCSVLCRAAITDEFVTSHTITEVRKIVMDPRNLDKLAQFNDLPTGPFFLAYIGCLSFHNEESCARFMGTVFTPLNDALAERSEQFRLRLEKGDIPERFLDLVASKDPYGVGIALFKRHLRQRDDAAQTQSKPGGSFENDFETLNILRQIEESQHPLQLSAPLVSSTQTTVLTTHKNSTLGSHSSSPSPLASRFSGPSAILKSSSQEKENTEPSRTLLSRLSSPHTSRRFRQRPY
ncbi:hypothetical protein C8R46DRAFT_1354852 [Mycena filopes]|nr:hypothetical protein C8R46DRAFT_1354852 [Mycena filopes]